MSLTDYTSPPDPMMEELRAIRDELSAQMLTMSIEEQLQSLSQETDAFLAEQGYELRPHPTNTQWKQLVKRQT